MVTAVLADYRGYDTMFETVVIFTAGIAIIAILRRYGPKNKVMPEQKFYKKEPDLIVETTCRLMIPIIQLFALYVVAHGHHSPGGGFQGGVIFGASFILLALARDLQAAQKWVPENRILNLAGIGIFIYAGFGFLCLLLGSNFLDYSILHKVMGVTPIEARSHSMLGVEIGVAFTVAAIMFSIYSNLASKGEMKEGL
jgi:multicomponent Na+:H+ antiporter subunit B